MLAEPVAVALRNLLDGRLVGVGGPGHRHERTVGLDDGRRLGSTTRKNKRRRHGKWFPHVAPVLYGGLPEPARAPSARIFARSSSPTAPHPDSPAGTPGLKAS